MPERTIVAVGVTFVPPPGGVVTAPGTIAVTSKTCESLTVSAITERAPMEALVNNPTLIKNQAKKINLLALLDLRPLFGFNFSFKNCRFLYL